MEQQLLAAFIQAFVASIIGSYGGYRYAIRNTPAATRPAGTWQLSTCLLSAVAGAIVAMVFEVSLTIAYAETDTSKLTMVPLLCGFAIEILQTQRFLKRSK